MTTAIHCIRAAGILLHPTSLPGPYGIGDLGPAAYAWVEALMQAGQRWWQILPLGPTGYGDSPYQCFSAFAGNTYLISPDLLVKDGLLNPPDIPTVDFPAERVDYGRVIAFKLHLLEQAWKNFQAGAATHLRPQFDGFCETQAMWLEDYALFMALKDANGGGAWTGWEPALVAREPAALSQARAPFAEASRQHCFNQFLFFRQWYALKEYANTCGVRLIGDVPIFVAHDSADLWAHPELVQLDARKQPTVVAGVPPDAFCPDGQLWGNPLYDWEYLQQTGYAWWIERLRATHRLVDLVRLDHFLGFAAYWEVPATSPTAAHGRWVPGPGAALFNAVRSALGELPLIAEDLGSVTPAAIALRDQFDLPGMKILQFAWDAGPTDPFLPHNFTTDRCVVYTGTHDNETTLSWWTNMTTEKEREFCLRYLARDKLDVPWDFIRLAWSSSAQLAIVPLQDILSLTSEEGRMNWPGIAGGNWQWRYLPGQLTNSLLERLGKLTALYGRNVSE